MKVTINQPLFFQRLHMVNRIAQCDVAVILHSAQFVRGGDQSKLFIRSANGVQMMKVPTRHGGRKAIKDTEIDYNQKWQKKMIRAIELNYGKAPLFHLFFDGIKKIINGSYSSLGLLDIETIKYGLGVLGIKTKVILDDELEVEYGNPSEWMLNICKVLGATEYHCGRVAAEAYLDFEKFEKAGIKVIPQDWKCKEYPQLYGELFIPDLSIIDILMNIGNGEKAKEVIGT